MTKANLALFKRVSIHYYPGNKVENLISYTLDFIDDDEALLRAFLALDLSALSEAEKDRIVQTLVEIPRCRVLRVDSAEPILGLVTVALKRK